MINHTYTLEKLLENQSFRRWAKGKADADEKVYWDEWVMICEANRKVARTALAALSGFSLGSLDNPDARQAWQRLNKRIGQEFSINGKNVHGNKRSKVSEFRWVYKVAAGIMVILTAGLIVYFGYSGLQDQKLMATRSVEQEISTVFGEQKVIRLADGSVITLNANSKLVYDKDPLHPTNIEIRLQGEAFFFVAHREKSDDYPFRVRTEDGTVHVLGTKFAVSTRNSRTQVILEEGSVGINLNVESDGKPDSAVLKPSQLAEFDNQVDSLIIRQVNTKVYTSWTTSKLVFDNTPLIEVLKRIEYTFGVDVQVKNPNLYDRTVSGTIENAGMSVILSTLSKVIAAPIEVRSSTVYVGKS